jgi:hypothetical protein
VQPQPLRAAPGPSVPPPRAAPESSTAVALPLPAPPEVPQPPQVPKSSTPTLPAPPAQVPKSSTPVALPATLPATPVAKASSNLPAPQPEAHASGTLTTTISDAAGMIGGQPRRRTNRLPLLIAVLALLGAVLGTVFVLGGGRSREPSGQISYGENPASSRSGGTGATGSAGLASSPPQAAGTPSAEQLGQPPADPLVDMPDQPAPPAAAADDPAVECARLQIARKWSDLAQCADRLTSRDPKRAAQFRTRAAEEARSAPRIAAAEAALRDKNLKQAWAELAQVWPASVDLPGLRQRYGLAEARAIDELAAELARVKDSDCQEYGQLLAKEQAAAPPRVAAEAARRTGCTPCNADVLADTGQKHFIDSRLVEALAAYEAAYACRPDPAWTDKAFIIACNLGDRVKARLHWRRLPALRRTRVVGICEQRGITAQILDAP